MIIQAFHDVHNPDLAVLGRQSVEHETQDQGAGEWQQSPGQQVQIFKGFRAVSGQEVFQGPFDG